VSLFTRSGLDAREAAALVECGEAVVLDVRERIEWNAGHVPGARHVPLDELGTRKSELPPGRTIVAVCRSGSRSRWAVKDLRRAGFTAENLRGGLRAWERAGLPLEPRGGRVL
jgi:rhodanese-related sulfurtransferase